jgi:hypothetical protein
MKDFGIRISPVGRADLLPYCAEAAHDRTNDDCDVA